MTKAPTPTILLRRLAPALATALLLPAQAPPFLPGVDYDPAIPTMQQVLGHAPGDEILLHAEVEQYLHALAAAAPDRVRIVEYGKSWEGRQLCYAVVGSKEHLAALPELQRGWQRLADPRGLEDAEAQRLVGGLPALAWLAYCVHGDEPSGSDAALVLLHHLLAARGNALCDAIARDLVVIVDPLQNPDGRDRFVHGTRAARGLEPAAEPSAAEHTQPWPGGRVNHYLFDMNRDWFALTQPETQARVAAFQQWWPQVYVDLHEMGGNSTYYFAPPASPLNPEITAAQRDWLLRYGRNNAAWFDRFGIDYFTREEYDSFYPGYGEGWPTFHGAIGMTFEQGSARGLVFRRDDESLLSYRDCVLHHFLASLGTLETLSVGCKEALAAFLDYRRSAIAEGERGPVRAYVFPDRGDRSRVARLVNLLLQQGIEVQRADGGASSGACVPLAGGAPSAQTFPAGSYVVDLAQPGKRLASVLLSRHFDMDPKFLEEQLHKQQRRKGNDFYDLTGWSLPLLFDVETWTTSAKVDGTLRLLHAGEAAPAYAALPEAAPQVGYVVPWTNGGARLLVELLKQGVKVRSLDKPFRLNGRDFAAGAFVARTLGNPKELPALIRDAAARCGAEVVPTDTSWVESGIHFGSNNAHPVLPPKVAMAWDRPVSANSAGWARFLLERRYGLPVTPIRTPQLASADLDRFTVLVLPDGQGYGQILGKGGAARIAQWVERGGVLVALGSACRWLAEDDVALLASKPEDRTKPKKKGKDGEGDDKGEGKGEGEADKPDAKPDAAAKPGEKPAAQQPADTKPAAQDQAKDKDKDKPEEPFDYAKAIVPDKEPPPRTPGAILRVALDPEHWLAFGCGTTANVVNESSDIFTPVKLDRGTNVAVYAAQDQLVLAGFTFEEAKKQLANKAWLVHQPRGEGHVVAFAEDPNVRCFADGLNLMFLNAVLLGAGR